MLNAIWIVMILGALVCGALTGKLDDVAKASTESAKGSVDLAIGLVGVMTLWLGFMKILQRGGLLKSIAKALKPLMKRLFPDIPSEHPAMSMMILNISANMFGLANAATPFGLKAMIELDSLNKHRGISTNSMALFLAINTSGLALLPTGMIAVRASLGSASPGSIVVTTIMATMCSTLVAIVACKFLQGLPMFKITAADIAAIGKPKKGALSGALGIDVKQANEEVDVKLKKATPGMLWLGRLAVLALVFSMGYALIEIAQTQGWAGAMKVAATQWPLVILMAGFILFGVFRGVNVYDSVVEGGKEGFSVALRIIPYLVAILVAVGMFRASGALDLIVSALTPLTNLIGMPAEALPMALVRTLSGSGALGVASEIMQTHGPDSFVGNLVATMQGSTETTFYVLAVYFGTVQVRNTRHTLPACLIADAAGILGAVWACHLFLK